MIEVELKRLCGIMVPIVTPVDGDNRVDTEKLERVVNHVIDGGVHGILAFGSIGEFFAIDYEQQRIGLDAIVKAADNRVQVYMGIAGITTKECVQLAKMSAEVGADGISILPPMFIQPSERELYQHFVAIANTVPHLSVLLYNDPEKVGYGISVSLLKKLAPHPNILGIKDSSGNLHLTAEYIRNTLEGDFVVFAGRDSLILGSLVYGAVGAVAATANVVPELVVSIYDYFNKGNLSEAHKAQFDLTSFRNIFDRSSLPSATKDACNLIGLDVGTSILPNTVSTPDVIEEMRTVLTQLGYIKSEGKN